MKVQKNQVSRKRSAGFSLVELLVVIAVIGIMAAIAIPIISNINQNANTAKNKRNAQNVVSVANSALAAGASLSTASAQALMDDLQAGKNGTGQFSSTLFKVDVTDTEEAAVLPYISVSNGAISYNPGS